MKINRTLPEIKRVTGKVSSVRLVQTLPDEKKFVRLLQVSGESPTLQEQTSKQNDEPN